MKEYIHVVDESDQVIGSKERSDIDPNNDIYRVSALWLKNSKGEILLAQRKKTKKKDPGVWGPAAAGTVESSETYDTNILKEVEEEIGLKDIELTKGPKAKVSYPRNFFTQWYFATQDLLADEIVVQEEEVEQVQWFDLKSIRQWHSEKPQDFVPYFGEVLSLLEPQE